VSRGVLAAAAPAGPGGAPELGSILDGGSPRVVLARLLDGDPLGIRPRVGEHLRREALFLDVDRVALRALALCALEAASAPRNGTPGAGAGGLAAWLAERVERAARAVRREDVGAFPVVPGVGAALAEGARAPGSSACATRAPDVHDQLARALGLEPAATRAACAALNLRPADERAALQAWLVERASLDAVASAFGVSASEIARRARRALDAALTAAFPPP